LRRYLHQDGVVRLPTGCRTRTYSPTSIRPYYEKGSALYLNAFNDEQLVFSDTLAKAFEHSAWEETGEPSDI
jgi:hypothetical protein